MMVRETVLFPTHDKIKRRFRRVVNIATEEVILGDENGRVNDPVDPRYWLVRRDENSQAFPILWSARGQIGSQAGTRVWIGEDYDKQKKILSVSTGAMIENGKNPNTLNTADQRLYGYWDAEGYTPLLARAISTASEPSTKIYVYPASWGDDTNTLKVFIGAQIDLASYIPTAGNHRLVAIFVKDDMTLTATTSTSKSMVLGMESADLQECLTNKPAKAIHVAVYKLANGQTAITEANRFSDPRFLINLMPARNKWDATTAPTSTDDSADGYGVGSWWIDTTNDKTYICVDSTASSAVWQQVSGTGVGTVTTVTASSPLASSGGSAPNITLNSVVPLAKGGSNADMSATGGSGHVVKQSSVGANFTTSKVDLTTDVTGVLPVANGAVPTPSAKGDIVVYNGSTYVVLPAGTNGYFLKADSSTATGLKWDVVSGSGTVYSVGLSTNASWFTVGGVGGNPITGAGTFELNKTTGLTANRFLATPDGSTGVVDLRAIVFADLPSGLMNNISPLTTKGDLFVFSTTNTRLGVGADGTILTADSTSPTGLKWGSAGGSGTVTSVGITAPSEFNVTGSPVTGSGNLGLAWANQTTNKVFASPNGSTGTPTFRALVNADLPTVQETKGGTNQTGYTTGNILYASATDTLSKLAIGSTDQVLKVSGGVPAWGAPNLGTLLAWTVLGGSSSSIQFTSIPSTYNNLLIVCALRGDRSSTNDGVGIRFNSDTTAANYYRYQVAISGTAGTWASSERLGVTDGFIQIGLMPANTATANFRGNMNIWIRDYASTSRIRTVRSEYLYPVGTTTGSIGYGLNSGWWTNTSNAITQVDLIPTVGANFVAGSAYALYGF